MPIVKFRLTKQKSSKHDKGKTRKEIEYVPRTSGFIVVFERLFQMDKTWFSFVLHTEISNVRSYSRTVIYWKSVVFTLEYRINGGGVRIIGGGGVEMVRHNNNRGVGIIGGGGCLEK